MSFDLAIWVGDRPGSNREAGETLDGLLEHFDETQPPDTQMLRGALFGAETTSSSRLSTIRWKLNLAPASKGASLRSLTGPQDSAAG